MKHISNEEILSHIADEKFVDLRRMYCEMYLVQQMGNGKLPYSFGNHDRRHWEHDRELRGSWDKPAQRLRDLHMFSSVLQHKVSLETLFAIIKAHIAGEKMNEPVHVWTASKYKDCGECGQYAQLWTNGIKMWNPHTCPYPDGQSAYHFDFNFPSGKIVVENDMRHLVPEHEDLYGNGLIWQHRISKFYHPHQMAHFFVGNTCPGLWEIYEDHYLVAPTPDITDYGWKPKASICTDLWWYSIMDHDLFIERGGKIVKNHQDIVEVTPSRYRFSHRYHLSRDQETPEIYTHITRVYDENLQNNSEQ